MSDVMNELYARLRQAGLKKTFVRQCLLPDWWDDSLAEVPANRKLIELTIAQVLGLKPADIRNPGKGLCIGPSTEFRLKHAKKGTSHEAVRVRVALAEKAAEAVQANAKDIPPYAGLTSALAVRESILRTSPYVNLTPLVAACWESGILVLHLDVGNRISGHTFHGVTFYPGNNPIIVLAYGSDSPPWLAFHLAHELGHVVCMHVGRGDRPLVDARIEVKQSKEKEEREANEFAIELLTGRKELSFKPARLAAPRLAAAASTYGREHGIDPGTCVLMYGRSANRWPAAQKALSLMGQAKGARHIIRLALLDHLCVREMAEPVERFLSCVTTEVDEKDGC